MYNLAHHPVGGLLRSAALPKKRKQKRRPRVLIRYRTLIFFIGIGGWNPASSTPNLYRRMNSDVLPGDMPTGGDRSAARRDAHVPDDCGHVRQ